MGPDGFVLEGIHTQCSFNYLNVEPKSRAVIIAMVIGGFVIPVSVMIVSYVFILMKLKSRKIFQPECSKTTALLSKENKNDDTIDEIKKDTTTEEIESANKLKNKNSNEYRSKKLDLFLKSELKATKNAILIVTLFSIAWFPYTVISLIAQFSKNRSLYVNPYTTTLSALFAKTSAIYNPIIYALTNRKFQMKFNQTFPYFSGIFPSVKNSASMASSSTFSRLSRLSRKKTLNGSYFKKE
jgi:hypothetical protein